MFFLRYMVYNVTINFGMLIMNINAICQTLQLSSLTTEFMAKLGYFKFHLVGHDLGGGISQIMAVNKPNSIIDLTLINSVAYDYWPVQPIIAMRTPIIRQIAMASLDFGTFKIIVQHEVIKN